MQTATAATTFGVNLLKKRRKKTAGRKKGDRKMTRKCS